MWVRVPPAAPRGLAQLVERTVWDREAGGSSPLSPTSWINQFMKPKRLPKEEFDYIFSKVPRIVVDLVIKTPRGIVLTKRKISPYKGKWHTPGGTIRMGETLNDAVERVAMEELGVKVKIEKFVGINEILKDGNTGRHTISLVYLVTTNQTNFHGDEQSSLVKTFKILPQNIIPLQKRFLTEHLGIK